MSTVDTDARRNLDDEARRYAEQRAFDESDPAKIERNIDETRADVRETLAALEQRLSVDRLLELTVGRIRDRGGEFASNLSDAATQHPIPLVLTSIGLGWLMLMSRRNGGSAVRPTGSMRDRAAGVRDRVMSAGDRVSEQVQGAVESSREAFDHAAESMRDTASRAARDDALASRKRARRSCARAGTDAEVAGRAASGARCAGSRGRGFDWSAVAEHRSGRSIGGRRS